MQRVIASYTGKCCSATAGDARSAACRWTPARRLSAEIAGTSRGRATPATSADVVAVGCSLCTSMMENSINALKGGRDGCVMDLSELLLQPVQPRPTAQATPP
jgi:Fe-S oxidoreductase